MLPVSATPESRLRLQYAQEIAAVCLPSLYDEIALTGSSARGIATPSSDLEINFWVQTLPDIDSRKQWMISLGTAQVIAHAAPRPDESYWVNGMYNGIEIEAGWQTFDALDIALTDLIEARTTDHKALRLAELVLSAKSLRGSGALQKWQPILRTYPSQLAPKLIEEALSDWLTVTWLSDHQASADYKDDIHRIWRIVFALNHQWEINWKYAHFSVPSLNIYPKNIANRIADMQQSHTPQSSKLMLELIEETLQCIQAQDETYSGLSETRNQCHLLLEQFTSFNS